MRKSVTLKFFIAYFCLIALSLIGIVKCNAQTIEGYTADFFFAADNLGVVLNRTAPTIVEQEGYLFMKRDGIKIPVDAYTSSKYNTIFFDVTSYTYQYNLKILVYHEYGHWYLYRDETTKDSIMNTSIWYNTSWDDLTLEMQEYYTKELFQK